MDIRRLEAFIKDHCFETQLHEDSVTFYVPVATNGIPDGWEEHTVSTFKEAREALGY